MTRRRRHGVTKPITATAKDVFRERHGTGRSIQENTMLKKFTAAIAGLAIAAVGVAAVAANISGAGATFPAPVYQKWAEAYKGATANQLNYQAIGSGGGIKQIEASTVDFGASDKPLKPEDLAANGLQQRSEEHTSELQS